MRQYRAVGSFLKPCLEAAECRPSCPIITPTSEKSTDLLHLMGLFLHFRIIRDLIL